MFSFINQWKWAIMLGFFAAWTWYVWQDGFVKGRGEQSKIQEKIDKADIDNQNLRSDAIKINDALKISQIELQTQIELSNAKHKDVKPQQASKCVGEDDYFGEKAANEYMRDFDKRTEAMLSE